MKRVSVLPIIALLFAANLLTCESAFADGLRAWGNDCCGQIGDLPSDTNFVAIVAGKEHGLAHKPDGTVVAWGQNSAGQSSVPAGLGPCIAIGAGWEHSLVVKADGSLAAWGANWNGQCNVPAGNDYAAVDGGEYYSVALKTDGSIVHWGYSSYGLDSPPAGNDFVAIAAGMTHCLALKSDGTVVAWGRNYENQCNVPAGTYVGIAAGKDCSFGLKTDGSIVHWGADPWSYGLDEVPSGNDFVAISSRYTHGLALKSDGSAVGWGAGSGTTQPPHYGQDTPPAGNDYTAIVCGGYWSLAMTTPPGPTIWHVDGDKLASGNGTSWAEAFKTIEEAIAAANTTDKEIWVKEGTYLISSSIYVAKAVEMYAGFAGTETDRQDRDWENNVTEIDGQDSVIHCLRVTDDARIDGFTITGGHSAGTVPDDEGGGMYIYNCDPSIANCTFHDNYAKYRGGAICVNLCDNGTISNCAFIDNISGSYGGAIHNYDSDLTITECNFYNNKGDTGAQTNGGAISNHTCAPTIQHCTFTGNQATNGAGISNSTSCNSEIANCTFADCNATSSHGGGIYIYNSSPTITKCVFYGNEVASGGAIYVQTDDANSPTITNCIMAINHARSYGGAIYTAGDPNVTNCTICGNTADHSGGAVYSYYGAAVLTNCILWGDDANNAGPEIFNWSSSPGFYVVANYCDIQGGYSGTNNIDVDPNFVDANNGDFYLTYDSDCIDVGDNSAPNLPSEDYDGNPRIVDGNDSGTAVVDMGAYEYQGRRITDHLFYGEIAQGLDYGQPDDPNVGYVFLMELETDDTVGYIDFLTPAAQTFSIPNDVNTHSGSVETEHYVEAGRHYWEYRAKFASASGLLDYGDGTYTITLNYIGGSSQQTSIWFGIPGTTNYIPQPTQEPVLTYPAHNGAAASPLIFAWQACTDTDANSIWLDLEKQGVDEIVEMDFPVSATSSDPCELSEGTWEAELGFGHGYETNSAEGVPVSVGKGTISNYVFEVVIPYHSGDQNEDYVIDDAELLDYIDLWILDQVGDFELLDTIDLWAAGHYYWDPYDQKFKPGTP